MPSNISRSTDASLASYRPTAEDGECAEHGNHAVSMFDESFLRSADGETILNPSAIIRQTPICSLHSLAVREASRVLSAFANGSALWDDILEVEPIEACLTQISSTDSEKRSSEIANTLQTEMSWYFAPENLKPGAPGWKLERQVRLFTDEFERVWSQKIRLEAIHDPGLMIPGIERLREADRLDPLALRVAEACAFKACVLRVMLDPWPLINPSTNEIHQADFMPDPLEYEGAAPEEKSRMLLELIQRWMVYQAKGELSIPRFLPFAWGAVNEHWLHMLALVCEFPNVVSSGSLPDWFKEDSADINLELEYRMTQVKNSKLLCRRMREMHRGTK